MVVVLVGVFAVCTLIVAMINWALPELSFGFFLLSGSWAAVYCATLLWLRGGAIGKQCAILSIGAGVTHPWWAVRGSSMLGELLGRSSGPGEIGSGLGLHLILTAIGFSPLVWLGARSVSGAVIVLGGGIVAAVVSGALARTYGATEWIATGSPLVLLHLSILTGLGLALHRWQRTLHRVGHCAACGYRLEGLESGVCPECGQWG